ncbi:MAG: Arm DNA-binding domain-containing protein, partial [Pseudomonadota bacterium]
MTRAINRLTAKQVTNLQNPGRYSDGGNLYLSISKTGSRKWIFMYRFAGRQREMGLGSANTTGISLATAREFAANARILLNFGKDPIEVKREK